MQSTVSVTLRLPPSLVERVLLVAEQERCSQREAYIRLLAEGLDLTPNEVLDLLLPPKPRRPRSPLLAHSA